MFLSWILGIENSFTRTLGYLTVTAVFYFVLGCFLYSFLVGLPLLLLNEEEN